MNIAGQGRGDGPVQKAGALVVIDIGPGVDVGGDHLNRLLFPDDSADFTLRIIEIAEGARLGGAGHHTRGLLAALQAVAAEIAFVRSVDAGVAVAGAVGAGGHAVAAADAFFGIDDDQPVGLLEGGIHRAGRHAGGYVALHALAGLELGFSTIAGFPQRPDPVSPVTFRYIVFHLARNQTGLAVDASGGVNDHPKFFRLTRSSCVYPYS